MKTLLLLLAVLIPREVDCQVKMRNRVPGEGIGYADTCACSGSNEGFNAAGISRFNDAKLFPADYGTSCKAWDKVDCPKAWPGETYGPWCCSSWCYVANATCEDAVASVESPGLFYAYFGPCGVDAAQVNATNCPLHHNWDGISSKANGFLKHILTYATGDAEVCATEEAEDTTDLKTLSYILGVAIVGSGFGVLFFVWVIRCDPAETRNWLHESLCATWLKLEQPSDGATSVPSPDKQQTANSHVVGAAGGTKTNLATITD